MAAGPPATDPSHVDVSAAHDMPALYQSVLTGLAELEARGHRTEAAWLRKAAAAAYGSAWNDASKRRLRRLAARADRVLTGHDRPRAMARSERRPILARLLRAQRPAG